MAESGRNKPNIPSWARPVDDALVTQKQRGLMSADDKRKLDTLAGGGALGTDTHSVGTEAPPIPTPPRPGDLWLDTDAYLSSAGGGGDLSYVHDQLVPAATWVVTHNLGKYPSVAVVDSGGTVVWGDVQHTDANHVTLSFAVAFGGRAYLN